MKIKHIEEDDRKFISEFKNLEMLSMNQTELQTIENFPEIPQLLRVSRPLSSPPKIELNENKALKGKELAHLLKFKELRTIKFANNGVESLEDLEPLKQLEFLENLDLSGNPVSEADEYKTKVFALLPKLNVLDGLDKEGNEVISDDGDEEEEEEEDDYLDSDIDEEEIAKIMQ